MSDLLKSSNLHFAYRDVPVLRDVSVSLAPGEVVALIGPNGSGKSTLIRTLLGQLKGTGSINWDGRDIHGWSRRELARKVAYLPQSPTYDPQQTVADALRLGRAAYWSAFGIESDGDTQIVRDVASTLDLSELLDRTMDELSGGQRQRVFVGRCLVQQPAAMLLDEPSTFLDLKHQVELCQLLRKLASEQDIGVLMASHDLNLIATFADRLILLDRGAVRATGSPATILTAELLSEIYGVPLRRIDVAEGKAPVIVPVT